MTIITELGEERKEAKKERLLILKALESDSREEDSNVALLATRIVRALKRGGQVSKLNRKIKGYHKGGSSEESIRNYPLQKKNQNPETLRRKGAASYIVRKVLAAWEDLISNLGMKKSMKIISC